jgi:hypothetical protein
VSDEEIDGPMDDDQITRKQDNVCLPTEFSVIWDTNIYYRKQIYRMFGKECWVLRRLMYVNFFSSFRQPQVDELIQDFEYARDIDSEPEEVGLEVSDSQDEVDRMGISGLDVGIHLGIYFLTIRNTHSGPGTRPPFTREYKPNSKFR